MAWSIETALQANLETWVSAGTDYIARLARQHGANAYVRPSQWSSDDAPMLEVVKDAIPRLGAYAWDTIVLLQPTSPFRETRHVLECVAALQDSADLDSAFTALRVPEKFHPDQVIQRNPKYPACRQTLAPVYVRAGSVYAFRVGTVDRHGDIYGRNYALIEVDPSASITLDEPSDWEEAETRIAKIRRHIPAEVWQACVNWPSG